MSSTPEPWNLTPGSHTITTSNNRIFNIHIPASYSPKAQHALILSIHGYGGSAKKQESLTGFSSETLRLNGHAIIAVYPQGLVGVGKPGEAGKAAWQGAPYAAPDADDIAFTEDIISSVQANASIDPARIYITGQSNGGGFTNLLARTPSISNQIAAFASGSAALYPGTLPGVKHEEGDDPASPPSRGVPFLETHGTADKTIPYTGRTADKNGDTDYATPDIQAWRAAWAKRNGCPVSSASGDESTSVSPDSDWDHPDLPAPTSVTQPFPQTTLYTWACPNGADILGYTVEGMGHTWVTDPPEPFNAAADVIIPFFEAHPLNQTN